MNKLERLSIVANQFEREVAIAALKTGHNAKHQALRNQMIEEHGLEWVENVETESHARY